MKEWNEQLSAVGIEPDLSTLSAQIVAWKNVQDGKVKRINEAPKIERTYPLQENGSDQGHGMQMDVETVFTAAQNCTKFLGEILQDRNMSCVEDPQNAAALLSMFTHTIQAWSCASQFSLLHPTSSISLDASHGVSKMLDIGRVFHTKLCDDNSEEYSQHVLSLMGQVYSEIAIQLQRIDSAECSSSDEANTVSHFCYEIADIERMLRDYEIYSRIHLQSSTFTSASKAIRFALYKDTLRGCTAVKSPRDYGHVIRLCNLIMDHVSWQNKNCHEIRSGNDQGADKDDITDIFVNIAFLTQTVVENAHERMYVLTAVYKNASPFFAQKKKFQVSSYAVVDRARLIGAMRKAMGDSELTEPFLHNFEERRQKRKPVGNTAMSFVYEMMGKNKKRQGSSHA